MRKEEILDRYRREGTDEGREQVNRRGDDAGFYALLGLALPLMLYQVSAPCPLGICPQCCSPSARQGCSPATTAQRTADAWASAFSTPWRAC